VNRHTKHLNPTRKLIPAWLEPYILPGIFRLTGHLSHTHFLSGIMISGIAHVNITIPKDTLHHAQEFYGTTLGLISAPVPELQKGTILWYADRTVDPGEYT
jgi:hypothetical protein